MGDCLSFTPSLSLFHIFSDLSLCPSSTHVSLPLILQLLSLPFFLFLSSGYSMHSLFFFKKKKKESTLLVLAVIKEECGIYCINKHNSKETKQRNENRKLVGTGSVSSGLSVSAFRQPVLLELFVTQSE